ncbi:2,3-bisphosphoglycerate-dependent phosphoglycerate mutase [Candidatus Saccharibacteria bacterium]|nr:2,3-bisphosphoglycerate-dependent phosphoglycerate mutase [Candidatus Saccharibacteria bacterium]
MAKIQIFDSTDNDKQQLGKLIDADKHEISYIDEPISIENLDKDSEIIAVFVSSNVTSEIMSVLPKLKLIVCRSTGFNNIDLETAAERKIHVTNVPSYGDETVAEYAFAMLLSLSRKIIEATEAVRIGKIELPELMGFDLHGKKIGLVGAGRIGQATARIAKGFGMEVFAYDPFPNDHAAEEIGFKYVGLDRLLEISDVVSIHSPYVGSNFHLFNEQAFTKMKTGAVLINTARGELVDSKDLIEALASKKLAGAALDVLHGEKLLDIDQELIYLRSDHPSKKELSQSVEISILQRLPNVIITPHNAFNTKEAIGRINKTTVENIEDFLDGKHTNIVRRPKAGTGKLFIARHGESEWNALGKWTGTRDVHLTEKGFKQAAKMGIAMADHRIDYAYCSQQIRALETMENIFSASQQFDVPYERAAELNERDYGDYTGKNKIEMKAFLGDKSYLDLRRGWDYPVPNGETLKDVYNRAVPFYLRNIVPKLLSGKNVLIVAHGNSIRSLIKYIESLSNKEISEIEMIFNSILIYEIKQYGRKLSKIEAVVEVSEPVVSKV